RACSNGDWRIVSAAALAARLTWVSATAATSHAKRRATRLEIDRSTARCIGSPCRSESQHTVVELRPMPRLEREAERVVAIVRHSKAEPGRVVLEPEERFRRRERFRQRPAARRRDVDGFTRVVLTVPRGRVRAEDRRDVVAALELRADQRDLPLDAA